MYHYSLDEGDFKPVSKSQNKEFMVFLPCSSVTKYQRILSKTYARIGICLFPVSYKISA